MDMIIDFGVCITRLIFNSFANKFYQWNFIHIFKQYEASELKCFSSAKWTQIATHVRHVQKPWPPIVYKLFIFLCLESEDRHAVVLCAVNVSFWNHFLHINAKPCSKYKKTLYLCSLFTRTHFKYSQICFAYILCQLHDAVHYYIWFCWVQDMKIKPLQEMLVRLKARYEYLQRGPLSLLSTFEELFWRKNTGSGLESREYGSRDPSHWPHGTLYSQTLALT
jgi:hypothetical protein